MADISIILASHNGANSLPRCLAALREQQVEGISSEFILVDNASTDTTHSLMLEFLDGRDGIVLQEKRKGKSFALNCAIEHARSDLIIFIDDDVLPAHGWLQAYADIANKYSQAALFAGALGPDWPVDPAQWQQDLALAGRSFGCTPSAQAEGPCRANLVKGGNFAVRKRAIETIRFDEGASNFGDGGVGGEDTKFANMIAQSGGQIIFAPDARALHIVKLHELSLRSIAARYRRIGKGSAVRKSRLKILLLALPAIAILAALSGLAFIFGQKGFSANCLTRAFTWVGRLEYAVGL